MIDLAFHLASFPFPSHFLPPLPARLGSIERAKLAQNRHMSVNISYGTSWWDLVPDNSQDASLQVVHLPDPPTGSAESGTWGSRLGRTGAQAGSARTAWTVQKYEYALASAKCLEICLLYLQIRADSTSGLSFLPLDGLSIAIGICRCSDAARAIHERLGHLSRSSNANLASMLQSTFTLRENLVADATNYAEEAERTALTELGPRLGQCASNLLTLVYAQSKTLNREVVASHGTGASFQVKSAVSEFASCIVPSLEHTQIESTGIGCYLDDGDGASPENEFIKAVAKHVREELDRLSKGLAM